MTSDESLHPEVETMAAFIDGTLAPSEVATVAQHLAQCEDCRTIVSETARFEREESPEFRTSRSKRWMFTAAAAISGALALAIPVAQRIATTPVQMLAEAAPRDHRSIEPRLSGFAWARLESAQRSGTAVPDLANIQFQGVAAKVLEETTGDTEPDARHGAGLAHLITDRYADSVAALAQAANGSKDAAVWSDLAAARYVAATKGDRSSQFAHALAAADHAISLDAGSKEAHFNRALILEALKMRDQAKVEWEKYLQLDSGSPWAVEARKHLADLAKPSASLNFNDALDCAIGDPQAIAALVPAFPEKSRSYAEAWLPAQWAKALRAGDVVLATEQLSLARSLAAELARGSDEHLAFDAIALIDRTSGESRITLADAYRLYDEGRTDLNNRLRTTARPKLLKAEAMFRAHGSAMAEWAATFAAQTLPDRSRGREELQRILSRVDPRYPALKAQVLAEMAVCASIAGDWGSASREAQDSATIFTSLHERANAAASDGTVAYALERIGASDQAWSRRIRAIAALSGDEYGYRRSTILHAAALALESNDRLAAAAAVMDVGLEEGRHGNVVQRAIALAERARLANRIGDSATARRALDEVRAAAMLVRDEGLREPAIVQADLSNAVLLSSADPRASLTAIDGAIRYFTVNRSDTALADAYLQRARVHHRAGDLTAADADYEAAFERVKSQRRSLRDGEVPIAFVDTMTQIYEEQVDLQLARGDAARALDEAERVHAVLRQDRKWMDGPSRIPDGVAVLRYVLLPEKLVIFCATNGSVIARTVDIDRSEVAQRIITFNERLRGHVPERELNVDAALLYKMLIAPVRAELAGKDEIVLIRDRQLHMVPFAALYDDGEREYLVERFTIRFAVSLAGAVPVPAGTLTPAVVIANPATTQDPALPFSLDEAEQITEMHGATLLVGAAATPKRFRESVKDRALVHYAGHADSDAGPAYGALLLAKDGQDPGIFGSSDISRLDLARHPLVVLAGCGTVRGEAVHIAGMASIARAFLDAGARAVVGTMWEIDDDVAADLFLRFHKRLRKGAAPARALRDVQTAMLHGADAHLAHPAAWAPVEVISNG